MSTPNTLLKDGVLRDKAVPVQMELVPRLTAVLVEALAKLDGVGLAAPQVGIGARIALVQFDGQRLVLVNPSISLLGRPRDRVENTEGCLSLPGRLFAVKRHPSVTVTTRLPEGHMTLTAHGWLARMLQHEIDHLDGICVDQRGTEVQKT